jgi:uroporphyrinogen-III synthase
MIPKSGNRFLDKIMHHRKMRVLVTRPLPDGERTAATLRAQGHDVLLTPLMQVRPVSAVVNGTWSAVIITSANALRALTPSQLAPLLSLPLYAVGQRSAETARAAGFREVRTPHADAHALVRLIAERHANEPAPYLYIAGQDRAADIEGALAAKGIKVATVIVYRNMTTGFPPELFDAVERNALDVVLHFSRRSAENFVAGAKSAGLLAQALAPKHLCLSAQVAEPLQTAGARNVAVAGRPDETALMGLVSRSTARID